MWIVGEEFVIYDEVIVGVEGVEVVVVVVGDVFDVFFIE